MTRNASSAEAQAFGRHAKVSVPKGDLDVTRAIFSKSKELFYGVFSVQTPLKTQIEEEQGKALVETAAANGVKCMIYASVERGGSERCDRDCTPVRLFISKFNIEKHLKEVKKRTNLG
jgi:NmrA-like family